MAYVIQFLQIMLTNTEGIFSILTFDLQLCPGSYRAIFCATAGKSIQKFVVSLSVRLALDLHNCYKCDIHYLDFMH